MLTTLTQIVTAAHRQIHRHRHTYTHTDSILTNL